MPPAPVELTTYSDKPVIDRAWARDLLVGAGMSQRDLARAWRVNDSYVSRWLDGHAGIEISLRAAVVFCHLVRLNFDELIERMGLEQPTAGTRPVLAPTSGPPLPTIKITPGSMPGKWYLLAHIEVSTDALSGIAHAFDEAAADVRVRKRKAATEAKLADFD